MLAVGEVDDVGDAAELLGVDGVLDLLDDLLRPHHVRQLGDDQPGAAGGELLDLHLGAGLEGAAAGGVGVADAVQADDPAAGGQVRAGDELHEVLERGVRVRDQVPGGGDRPRPRLCGAMLVAMPTAMPVAPLTSRFGNAAGSTSGWVSWLS